MTARLDYLGGLNVHGRIPRLEIPHLEPVCVVIAPNDAGKSSLLDLVRIAVSPKPAEAAFRVAGFEVMAEWSDNTSIRRVANGKGHDVWIDTKPRAVKEAASMVAGRLGRPADFSVDAWLGATAIERSRVVDDLLPPGVQLLGAVDAEALRGVLRSVHEWRAKVGLDPIDGPDPHIGTKREWWRAAVDGIDPVVTEINARLSSAKANAEVVTRDRAGHLPTLVAKRDTLRTELAAAVSVVERAAGAADAARRLLELMPNANALREARELAEQLEAQASALDVQTLRIEAIGEELADVEAKVIDAERAEAAGAAALSAGMLVAALTADQRAVKGFQADLRKEYARAVAAAAEQAVEGATQITRPVAGFAIQLAEIDGALELVAEDSQGRLRYAALNRSRQVIAGVALYVAVTRRLSGWRCVVLDRFEEVGQDRRTALLRILVQLVERGELDNVLVACVDDGWRPDVDGVQTVTLEAR